MEQTWRHLPPPARPIAASTTAAVEAVRAADDAALDDAVADLAGLDQAQTGLVLGVTVRLLLEEAHPDGIDADAVREVLKRAAVRPQADPQVMLYLLAGALGVLEEEASPAPRPDLLARNAALLLAELLGERPVPAVLTAALGEIQRAQLND